MYYGNIILNNYRMMSIMVKIFKGILDHYNEKLYNAFSGIDSISKIINQEVKVINENLLTESFNNGRGVIMLANRSFWWY